MVDNHKIMIGSKKFIAGTEASEESKISSVYLSIDNKLRGFFKMDNHYREGLQNVITGMRQMHLHLLTGDNNSEETNLKTYFSPTTQLHFNQSPVDKLNYINDIIEYEEDTPKREEFLKTIGMLYEENSKAGPRGINGFPMFMSCNIVSMDDTKRFIEMYKKYENMREEFEKEWN